MTLLLFRGFSTRSLLAQGEQRLPSYFNIRRDIPPKNRVRCSGYGISYRELEEPDGLVNGTVGFARGFGILAGVEVEHTCLLPTRCPLPGSGVCNME